VIRVGLTGGIGSGKSTVSALLRERGAVVIDYDVLARQIVGPGEPALDRIAARFGAGVLTSDGVLDRRVLASIVFADEDARRDLEAITHPAILRAAERIESASGDATVVVHDVPLLAETGVAEDYDVVLVVDAPESAQVERLMRDRRMDESEARARIRAQAGREQRLAVADHVIDNSDGVDDLARQVDRFWRRLTESGV